MTLPSTISSLVAGLEQTANRVAQQTQSAGDIPFLKLAKSGLWCYGAEEIEVEDGSTWAVNPNSLSTGYAAWGDSELLGEEMALVIDAPVDRNHLEDVGAAWKPQVGCQLACLDGEDEGTNVLYKTTSLGGQKAFKALLDAVLLRAKAGETDLVPVVKLKVDSYKHKKYGKVFTPVLDIVGWESIDGAPAGKIEASEPGPEPAATEPEPEPEQPARRRRRRG